MYLHTTCRASSLVFVDSAPCAFALQEVDETIFNRQQQNFAAQIVVAIATPAHRLFEIV